MAQSRRSERGGDGREVGAVGSGGEGLLGHSKDSGVVLSREGAMRAK